MACNYVRVQTIIIEMDNKILIDETGAQMLESFLRNKMNYVNAQVLFNNDRVYLSLYGSSNQATLTEKQLVTDGTWISVFNPLIEALPRLRSFRLQQTIIEQVAEIEGVKVSDLEQEWFVDGRVVLTV